MSGRVVVVGGGGEVVGVGFPLHLEHRDGDRLRQLRLDGEPLGGGPGIDHLLGVGVGFGQLQHIVEGVVDQQGAAQARGCLGGDGGIAVAQQFDQGAHVVAADHGGHQAGGLDRAHQGAGGGAPGHGAQPAGLHVGRLIHAGGDPLAEQVQQKGLLAGGGALQQLGEGLGLGGGEGQRRYAERLAFCGGLAVADQQVGIGGRGGHHA